MVRAAQGRQVKPTPPSAAKKRAGKGDYKVIRGFLTGIVWGGIVAGAGLAVISQVAPLPQARDQAEAEPAPAPEAAPVADPAPAEPAPAPEPQPEAEAEVAPELVPEPVPEPAPADLQPEILQKVPDPEPAPEPTPPAGVVDSAPAAPETPVIADSAAPAPDVTPEEKLALAPSEAPATLNPDPAPATADALPPPAPEPQDSLLQPAAPAPEPMADPAAPIQILPADPEPAPEEIATAEPKVIIPDGGAIDRSVPGVTLNRLPRIGDPEPEAEGMGESEALAEAAPEAVTEGATPLELFARPFENAEGKPLFSILLIDDGIPAEERAKLAALPFPVTFALDPLAPYSADAARVYRMAGQEVAMLASGIPQGATAADMEQTFQALDIAMPEAVVVLDRREEGFQASLDLARQAVPIVAEQGRGLVTYDQGLNSADQVARREGVARATIFRVLDAEGESIPKMRNYLDRAAFKAAQEGRVVVIGSAKAETVAAILEWTVEGRAASVALAPISAALEREASN